VRRRVELRKKRGTVRVMRAREITTHTNTHLALHRGSRLLPFRRGPLSWLLLEEWRGSMRAHSLRREKPPGSEKSFSLLFLFKCTPILVGPLKYCTSCNVTRTK